METSTASRSNHKRDSLAYLPASLDKKIAAAVDCHPSACLLCADIDPQTAGLIASILGPALTLTILLFIFRIPMSWYPNINFGKFPWSLVVAPTEPFLGPTRKVIPPVGGVDIAPVRALPEYRQNTVTWMLSNECFSFQAAVSLHHRHP